MKFVDSSNANHVLQKSICNFQPETCRFIYQEIAQNCGAIGVNKHGCCVLQRCLDFALPEDKNTLINSILECTPDFINDNYGNYVI